MGVQRREARPPLEIPSDDPIRETSTRMDEPKRLPRLYGDEDIGRILKRATELQRREPTAPPAGVTLEELEEIASEAGIDPTYLRRAAMELDAGRTKPGGWLKLLGDDVGLVYETTLPGEAAEEDFERILATIQATSKDHGQPSVFGRTLTWRAETASKSRTVQVVVTSRDGTTHIRAEENLTQMAGQIFGGVIGGGGVGVGIGVGLPIGIQVLGSALFATLAPIGVVGIGYVAARGIYRTVVGHRRRALSALFDRVVLETEAAIEARETGTDEASTSGLPSRT
jgi:hypothetical protein